MMQRLLANNVPGAKPPVAPKSKQLGVMSGNTVER
jgi:hypothetical protein